MKEETKLERCGFCGAFFRGDEYLSSEETNLLSKEQINDAPLGYCPNAGNEDPGNQPRFVTRDMAIDAGDINLEGQRYY